MQINQVREFFWPILDPLPEANKAQTEEIIDIHIQDDNLDTAFDLKIRFANNEEDRRKGVESKAALLLSSISLATSLVVGADTFVGPGHYLWARIALKAILLLLCCYTLMTVIFAIKCLSRAAYHTLDFHDINVSHPAKRYKRELIITMHTIRKANQKTVNEKVDCMVMAQEFYKRSIVVIALYVFCGLIITILKPNSPNSVPAAPNRGNTTTTTPSLRSTAHP